MPRVLKEPLVHFLLIGAALFGLFEFVGDKPAGGSGGDRGIVVTAGRIEQLARVFAKTWQRPPTPEELKGMIDDFVLEEAYYRQAVQMGIDENDTMIRRRLRQKLEFLTDDAAAVAEPSDEDLRAYLNTHREKFRTEPVYTLRQIYFNPERHGDDPVKTVAALADELRAGGSVEGDRTLLAESFDKAPARAVDSTFGTGFAAQLDSLEPGQWSDPVASGLGLHLVLLDSRTPGQDPDLAEVRAAVVREWANDRRLEVRKQFNEKLLEGYEVVVEWPASGGGDGETGSAPAE